MDGKTALHWTANNPDDSSARVLLEMAPLAINLRDNEGRTALHLAVVVGNTQVVEALVRIHSSLSFSLYLSLSLFSCHQ